MFNSVAHLSKVRHAIKRKSIYQFVMSLSNYKEVADKLFLSLYTARIFTENYIFLTKHEICNLRRKWAGLEGRLIRKPPHLFGGEAAGVQGAIYFADYKLLY